MGRYVIRRLLQLVLVVIGTTFLIYSAVWALPGDPLAGKCGQRDCNAEVKAKYEREYNLNEPIHIAYYRYMVKVAHGDLGRTFAGVPVVDQLKRTYPPTLKLASLAIAIEIIIGIGAGVLAGLRRGGFIDNLVLVTTLLVISMPVFVIGFLVREQIGSPPGWPPPTVGTKATWSNLVLPAFVLASLSLAYVARLMRSTLAENLRADYVRTGVAKGLTRSRVVVRHAVRNSLIPVVTYIGADFGTLLGGAIVTEGIFNIKGIGGLTYEGIVKQEGVTVVGVVTVLVFVFLLVNLLVDLLYAVLDPRIRYE